MNSDVIAKNRDLEAEVVVIGGGGAGLAAAVAASEEGAGNIIVLEKRGLGGNSALAFGIFAAESPVQRREMIDSHRDDYFKIAMNFAHWKINPRLVRTFIDKSGDTVRWLEEKGLEFECGTLGTNRVPAFHLPKGRGAALVKVLARDCRERGIRLLTRTPARKILTSARGNITGVLAEMRGEEFTITTGSVVIATGGFAGNKKLLRKYCPDYHDNMERIGLPHAGDGLVMATRIGAATEGLGVLLLGMTSAIHPPDLVARIEPPTDIFRMGLNSIAFEPRSLWVNKMGKRFADESSAPSTNAGVRQPDNVCYTLWDSRMTQVLSEQGPIGAMGLSEGASGKILPELARDLRRIQADKGLVRIFDSWEEMADWIGASCEVLKATIDEYNAGCDRGHDPVYAKDRKYLLPLRIPPYYAIRWHTSFINTIGGIKINEYTEVLDRQDKPIPGLYAAGVDTGGWESATYCMQLPGHGFGFSICSGRIAGENAARFVQGTQGGKS